MVTTHLPPIRNAISRHVGGLHRTIPPSGFPRHRGETPVAQSSATSPILACPSLKRANCRRASDSGSAAFESGQSRLTMARVLSTSANRPARQTQALTDTTLGAAARPNSPRPRVGVTGPPEACAAPRSGGGRLGNPAPPLSSYPHTRLHQISSKNVHTPKSGRDN